MKTLLAAVLFIALFFVPKSSPAQCAALLPGSAPTTYRITFSTGRVVRVRQVQPTPVGGNPCIWSSLYEDGAFLVMHSNTVTGSPSGGFMTVPSVHIGVPDGMNLRWWSAPAGDPRDGAGPFVVNMGGGVTATVTVGP